MFLLRHLRVLYLYTVSIKKKKKRYVRICDLSHTEQRTHVYKSGVPKIGHQPPPHLFCLLRHKMRFPVFLLQQQTRQTWNYTARQSGSGTYKVVDRKLHVPMSEIRIRSWCAMTARVNKTKADKESKHRRLSHTSARYFNTSPFLN